jgi:hypothetical protein
MERFADCYRTGWGTEIGATLGTIVAMVTCCVVELTTLGLL